MVFMGNALVIFKLYPEDIEDTEKIEAGLKELSVGKVQEVRREPIAFGLELVVVGILIPDKVDGMMEKLEDDVRKIPGVKEVEVAGMTLV